MGLAPRWIPVLSIAGYRFSHQNFAFEGSNQQQAFTRANAARQLVFRIDNARRFACRRIKTHEETIRAGYIYRAILEYRQKYRHLAFFDPGFP